MIGTDTAYSPGVAYSGDFVYFQVISESPLAWGIQFFFFHQFPGQQIRPIRTLPGRKTSGTEDVGTEEIAARSIFGSPDCDGLRGVAVTAWTERSGLARQVGRQVES